MKITDLSKLPPPDVLEELNFETLLSERKAAFIALFPQSEQSYWQEKLELESEPITKLLEENCYLQLLERQRINQAAKATMLAYATGADLDHLAANYNVTRLIIQAADSSSTPPKDQILESDDDLRMRVQLAFEGLTVAGTRQSYIFHAISAHSDVADIAVTSPSPASVTVTVLSKTGKGTPSAEVLEAVRNQLNDEEIRPIGDRVTVQGAMIRDFSVTAKLHLTSTPDYEPILIEARKRLNEYVTEKKRLGRSVTLSAVYAALHIEGVQRVELAEPSSDILLNSNEAGYCTSITLTHEVHDDD